MSAIERKELIRLLREAADYLEAEEAEGERAVPPFNKEEIVTHYMLGMGMSARPAGFDKITSAVLICIDDAEMLNSLEKNLYPKVADLYNTTPAKVKGSIRYSIKEMWYKGIVDAQYRIFGYSRNENHNEPSTKEFLCKFVKYIKINHIA